METTKPLFSSLSDIEDLIADYFTSIKGVTRTVRRKIKDENGRSKRQSVKITDREPEPPTAAGLMYFLGFVSKQQFEDYEAHGEYADQAKRAKLRIIAEYEKKLHGSSSTGVTHMLKTLGWTDRSIEKPDENESDNILKVEMVPSEHMPVSSESEVAL